MIALYISTITVQAIEREVIDITQMTQKERDKYAEKRKYDGSGQKIINEWRQTLRNVPALLDDGVKFAGPNYQKKYIRDKFEEIPTGDYEINVTFTDTRFSSKIRYEFKD